MSCVRYNSITRFNSEVSRTSRPRKKSSDTFQYPIGRKSESVSSSSSVSPASTTSTLPFVPSSYTADSKPHAYHVEGFSDWSSSSSVTTEDLPSFRSSPLAFDYSPISTSPSTPANDNTYQSFDISMNQPLPAFPKVSHTHNIYSNAPPAVPQASQLYKTFPGHSESANPAPTYPSYSQFPIIHGSSQTPDQFNLFQSMPASGHIATNTVPIGWNGMATTVESKPPSGGYRGYSSNDTFSVRTFFIFSPENKILNFLLFSHLQYVF